MLTPLLLALAIGYLLGSLPFGYLVARAKGVNIFAEGSRNPGATNVLRVLRAKFGPAGKRLGILVFFLDGAKGALSTAWPYVYLALTRPSAEKVGRFLPYPDPAAPIVEMMIAGLAGALIGHSFSCFTQFKGGKGVATASGGLLVLMPAAVLIGAVVWIATFYVSRYVSLASLLAAVAMPIAAFALNLERLLLGLTIAIAVLVIVRHRTNIQRLLNGTENKFVKKSATTSAPKS